MDATRVCMYVYLEECRGANPSEFCGTMARRPLRWSFFFFGGGGEGEGIVPPHATKHLICMGRTKKKKKKV